MVAVNAMKSEDVFHEKQQMLMYKDEKLENEHTYLLHLSTTIMIIDFFLKWWFDNKVYASVTPYVFGN